MNFETNVNVAGEQTEERPHIDVDTADILDEVASELSPYLDGLEPLKRRGVIEVLNDAFHKAAQRGLEEGAYNSAEDMVETYNAGWEKGASSVMESLKARWPDIISSARKSLQDDLGSIVKDAMDDFVEIETKRLGEGEEK